MVCARPLAALWIVPLPLPCAAASHWASLGKDQFSPLSSESQLAKARASYHAIPTRGCSALSKCELPQKAGRGLGLLLRQRQPSFDQILSRSYAPVLRNSAY